jgi:dTDP-4-dehydrorhamnose 3,5-epimerase
MIVPEGFGHAYITLEPNTTAVYVVSAVYAPEHESGIRFDDPALSIEWPMEPSVLSEKDLAWGSIDERRDELNERFRAC